jgi:hypothetical protein
LRAAGGGDLEPIEQVQLQQDDQLQVRHYCLQLSDTPGLTTLRSTTYVLVGFFCTCSMTKRPRIK